MDAQRADARTLLPTHARIGRDPSWERFSLVSEMLDDRKLRVWWRSFSRPTILAVSEKLLSLMLAQTSRINISKMYSCRPFGPEGRRFTRKAGSRLCKVQARR